MTRYEEKDKDRKVAISQYKSHFRVRLDASMLEAEGDSNGWRENGI